MEAYEFNSIDKNNDKLIDVANSLVNTSSSIVSDALDVGNIVIGNGKWIVDEQTTQESLIAEAKADVDGRIDSLFNKLRDRLPLNDDKQESAGNPFTEENPFANDKNPFGEGEFSPPPGYENSSLPSQ